MMNSPQASRPQVITWPTRVIDDTASLGHRFQCLVWNMVTTVSFVSLDFATDHQELNVMEAFQFNNKGDPYIEA